MKTTAAGSGANAADPHDVDNLYTFADGARYLGTAWTDFLVPLNTPPCFAGHCDWRFPDAGELLSLVSSQPDRPQIDPALRPTSDGAYWANDFFLIDPPQAACPSGPSLCDCSLDCGLFSCSTTLECNPVPEPPLPVVFAHFVSYNGDTIYFNGGAEGQTNIEPANNPYTGDPLPVYPLSERAVRGPCTPHSSGTFTDNCDGTVTDSATGLQWEKKTGVVGTGAYLADPHWVDNTYTWSATGTAADGTVFTDFLAKLNTPPCFLNHCDWRLPSEDGQNLPTGTNELESILLAPFPCGTSPCIDPIFGPTGGGFYWSSTTFTFGVSDAWAVVFNSGGVLTDRKSTSDSVRAVRGGS